jgi:hypothetical protein
LGNYAGRGFYTLLFEYLFLLFIVLVFRLWYGTRIDITYHALHGFLHSSSGRYTWYY